MEHPKKTEQHLVPISFCRNCEKSLQPAQMFCDACGAKRIKNRLTARNLAEDFSENFLNVENTIFKTFIALFTKPEDVIGGYIAGVRRRYVPAFSYFAISLTVAGLYIFVFSNYFMEDYIPMVSDGMDGQEQARKIFEMADGINKYNGLFTFLLIPLLAAISRLVFWNYKNFNYVEHVVIFLYAMSHFNICNYLLSFCFIWSPTSGIVAGLIITPLYLIYIAYVLKRVYNLPLDKIILKTLLFLAIGSVLLVAGIILFVVLIKYYGLFSEFFEAFKTPPKS